MESLNGQTKNGVCKKFVHNKCTANPCPYLHSKIKIKTCNNFQKGQCAYGENCDFSHQVSMVCKYFQKGKCKKGQECQFNHVYKTCPAYDMGFCFQGDKCEKKHIPRKLCQDYRYGFCPKGPRCDKQHPKIFNESDVQFTKTLFELLKKSINICVCYECRVIGHKAPNCYQRKDIKPQDTYDCAICNKIHSFDYVCAE